MIKKIFYCILLLSCLAYSKEIVVYEKDIASEVDVFYDELSEKLIYKIPSERVHHRIKSYEFNGLNIVLFLNKKPMGSLVSKENKVPILVQLGGRYLKSFSYNTLDGSMSITFNGEKEKTTILDYLQIQTVNE